MVKGPTYSGVLPFTVSAAIPRNFPIGTQREMHFVPRIAAQSAHVFSDPTFFPRRWSEKEDCLQSVRKRGLPAVNPLEKESVFFDSAFFFKLLLPLLMLSISRIMKRQPGVRGRVLAFTASYD